MTTETVTLTVTKAQAEIAEAAVRREATELSARYLQNFAEEVKGDAFARAIGIALDTQAEARFILADRIREALK